jgi:hypothetical protein
LTRPVPRFAFWLSLPVPGLGLVYAGAPLRGIAIFALAFLGFAGIKMGLDHGGHRPEYRYYGVIAALLLLGAWWGGARHAEGFASRQEAWPPLYRYFARPDVRQALWAARVELGMALFFAALAALYLALRRPPPWLPEPPRYWFLYEVFGAFYLAMAHQFKARMAGFFLLTLPATLALGLFTSLPKDMLAAAFILALPSCWYSLRYRGDEPAGTHWRRLFFCLLAGYLSLFGFGILVNLWEIVSGVPQYKLRISRDDNLAMAVFAMIYYLLRSAFEALSSRRARRIPSPPPPTSPLPP